MRASIRVRITVAATAAVVVALALGAGGFWWLLRHQLTDSHLASAQRTAQSLARIADVAVPSEDGDLLVQLVRSGEVVSSNDEAKGLAALTDTAGRTLVRTVDDERYAVASAGVSAEAGGSGQIVVVGVSLEDADESVDTARGLLLGSVPVVALLVAVTTWLTVGAALRPVERMRRTVAAVGPDDRSATRVPVPPGRDEIRRLAGTLNQMLERLQAAAERQRRFVSDASHELRSPVAAMRQQAEVAARHPDRIGAAELAGTVVAETDRLEALVAGMLLLTRSDEQRLTLSPEPVDVDDLVLAEAARLRAAGLRVDTSGVGPGRTVGDLRLLSQLVRNLTDNAARHADSTVGLGLAVVDDRVVLTVLDDGAGVDPADAERIFDRFVRLDDARARDAGGSGLGLAIVREVARAHGGDVSVDAAPSGGARFTVRLPADLS